jgi:C4-dicarboxylate-binding protein DctP
MKKTGIARVLTTLTAAAVYLCLVLPAGAAEPITIRFSHVVGENTPKGIGANLFKTLAEERLAGRVRVEVYPRSQKFNDNQVILGLLFGDVELAAPSLAKFRNFTKKLQVFDLPFLFNDIEAVHRFQAGETGRKLLGSMASRGIKGLAYWDNGARVISSVRPLRLPADAQGLTFRIEPSAVFREQYARLGVVAIPMPFKRVYDAVKEGLVKGQENAWSNIYSRRIHTLHRYFTEIEHSFLGYMVITSSKFWDGLPADIRSQLEAILAEVSTEVNRLAREKARGDRQKILESGPVDILALTDEQRAAWRKAMTPVWKEFEDEIGADTITAAVAANR